MVSLRAKRRLVAGSIPVDLTFGALAHLGERCFCKAEARGAKPLGSICKNLT